LTHNQRLSKKFNVEAHWNAADLHEPKYNELFWKGCFEFDHNMQTSDRPDGLLTNIRIRYCCQRGL